MRCPTLAELPPSPPGKTGWPWTEETPQLPEKMPNGHKWPLISIVTPSYNQSEFLEETIRSVLLQGYPNLEYRVMDGGSTDGSLEIIQRYEKWITQWVSEPDGGQAAAINKGWSLSTGEIVAYLNSDDLYQDGALAHVAMSLDSNPESKVLFGDCKIIERDGTMMGIKRPSNYTGTTLLLGRSLPQPAVFLHRQVLQDVGYLDPSLHYSLDWAYFLKVLWHYPAEQLLYIPHILAMSREYNETKSRTGHSRATTERRKVLAAYFKNGTLGEISPQLQQKAWTMIYWRQARLEWRGRAYRPLLQCLVTAVYFDFCSLISRMVRWNSLLIKKAGMMISRIFRTLE
jgi:glycosyltransferase involved in cell wall biosynthesis